MSGGAKPILGKDVDPKQKSAVQPIECERLIQSQLSGAGLSELLRCL